MMSSDAGIATAKYLVRCALPANDTPTVKDYTGALIRLDGEIGLAPKWKTGFCGKDCMERVSACLMALINARGEHVPMELSANVKNADESCPASYPAKPCNSWNRSTADDNTLAIGLHTTQSGTTGRRPPSTATCSSARRRATTRSELPRSLGVRPLASTWIFGCAAVASGTTGLCPFKMRGALGATWAFVDGYKCTEVGVNQPPLLQGQSSILAGTKTSTANVCKWPGATSCGPIRSRLT